MGAAPVEPQSGVALEERPAVDGAAERPRGRTALKAAVALVAILVVGLNFSTATVFPALISAGIWASAALGLGLLVGWAGQISLGQGCIVAVAAYGAAIASAKMHAPFLLAAAIGMGVALAVAVLTAPILRIRGFYFALGTLALATIVGELLVALISLTGGANGLVGIAPLELFGATARAASSYFYIGWGVALAGAVVLERMVAGRFGRALKLLRASPDVAAGVGVDVARSKMIAWLVSAVYAGAAGIVYAYYSGFLSPDQFRLDQSVYLLAAVMIGGSMSPWGTLIGAIVVFSGPQLLQLDSDATQLATAIILVVVAAAFESRTRAKVTAVLERVRRGLRARALARWRVGRREASAGAQPPSAATTATGLLVLGGGRSPHAANEAAVAPALDIAAVHKSFGGVRVLEGVDLVVERGTVQGVIGPNGAGKTSMLRCVMGDLPLDGGTVSLFGTSIAGRSTEWIAQHGLVRTFQHPRMIEDEPVVVNVMMGAHLAGRAGAVASILGRRAVRGEERQIRERAMHALQALGCEGLAGVPAGRLTAGQKRLVASAQALAAEPRVLLLDEPAAGLNDIEINHLVHSLLALKEQGLSIVVIEHHLDFVAQACDCVAALVDGRIVADGPPESVMRHDDVVRAYLGAPA